jgi:hypothetical protein
MLSVKEYRSYKKKKKRKKRLRMNAKNGIKNRYLQSRNRKG